MKKLSNSKRVTNLVKKVEAGYTIKEVGTKITNNPGLLESLNVRAIAKRNGVTLQKAAEKKAAEILSYQKHRGNLDSTPTGKNGREVRYHSVRKKSTNANAEVTAEVNTDSEFYIPPYSIVSNEDNDNDIDIYSILDDINKEYPLTAEDFLLHRPELKILAEEMVSQGRDGDFIAARFEEKFGSDEYDFDFSDYPECFCAYEE